MAPITTATTKAARSFLSLGSEHRYLRPDLRRHHACEYLDRPQQGHGRGDTAAIFALAISEDGKAIGTIEIEGAPIQTPAGGEVIDYRHKEEFGEDIMYEAGQTIGTGDAVIDSPITKLSPRARSSRLPRRSNPRRSQARPSPRVPSPRARRRPRPLQLQPREPKPPARSRQPAIPPAQPS